MDKISWMLKIKNRWLCIKRKARALFLIRWIRVDLDTQHEIRSALLGLRSFWKLIPDDHDQIKAGIALYANIIDSKVRKISGGCEPDAPFEG